MSLLRQSAWAAAAAITLTASRFALAAVIARRLSQIAFGQFAYGQWLVDLSFLACSLGVTGVIARYVAELKHDPGLLAEFVNRWRPFALGLPWLAGAGVLLGVWLSGIVLSTFAVSMLCLWAVANGLWAMQTAALSGLQRFDLIFLANVIASSVMLVGVLLSPINANDPGAVFGIMAIASGGAMLVGLQTTHTLRASLSAPIGIAPWRAVRRYAGNIWFSALVASLVWSRGELPIVRGVMGDAALAHYSAALVIFGGAVQGIMLGAAGVAPHLVALWGEGRKDEAVRVARTVMDLQLTVSAIGALFIVCFSEYILSFVFTDAYRDASQALTILCLGLLSFAVSGQSQLLQLRTDARFNRNAVMVGLVALYSFAAILIPVYGLIGAAVARTGAMVALGVTTLVFAVQYWGRQAISLKNIISTSMILCISVLFESWLRPTSFVLNLLLFLGGVGTLAFILRDQTGRMVIEAALRRSFRRVFSRKHDG